MRVPNLFTAPPDVILGAALAMGAGAAVASGTIVGLSVASIFLYAGGTLDVGHAAVYGEDLAETIHRSAGHITGVHLEDIVGGREGKHYHLVPGDGDFDFRGIFDAFDDVGYDSYATLELYTYPDEPDTAASRSYEALEEYL